MAKSSEGEEELLREKFNAIVEGLSLDESAPTTYLDELEKIEESQGFKPPNPAKVSLASTFQAMKRGFKNWFNRPHHDGDGVVL